MHLTESEWNDKRDGIFMAILNAYIIAGYDGDRINLAKVGAEFSMNQLGYTKEEGK